MKWKICPSLEKKVKEELWDESNIPIISCHGEVRTQLSVPEKKPISMVERQLHYYCPHATLSTLYLGVVFPINVSHIVGLSGTWVIHCNMHLYIVTQGCICVSICLSRWMTPPLIFFFCTISLAKPMEVVQIWNYLLEALKIRY